MRFTITALALLSSTILVAAAPTPWDGGSAYTGAGGEAVGGSTNLNGEQGGLSNGAGVLDLAGGNAGNGGKATSGTAIGGHGATA